MEIIELLVKDFSPISINQAWQGRRFKTKEYKDWRENINLLLPKKKKIGGRVGVSLIFYLKNVGRMDIDNLIKPVLDAIVEKGYIDDDRYIYELDVKKVIHTENAISVVIYSLPL